MDDLAKRIRLLKKLTLKQRRILELLLQELTYPQIVEAERKQWNWPITTDTVEYHVGQIFQKLGILEGDQKMRRFTLTYADKVCADQHSG